MFSDGIGRKAGEMHGLGDGSEGGHEGLAENAMGMQFFPGRCMAQALRQLLQSGEELRPADAAEIPGLLRKRREDFFLQARSDA